VKRATNKEIARLRRLAADGYNAIECAYLLNKRPDWVYYWTRALGIWVATRQKSKTKPQLPPCENEPLTPAQCAAAREQAKQSLARLFEEQRLKPEIPYDNQALWGKL